MQFQLTRSRQSQKLPDNFNFVKIVCHCINDSEDQIMTDDWGQIIAPGQVFTEGSVFTNFRADMNQHSLKTRGECFFFFKESIVYLFVQHAVVKGRITIFNNEKCDIINFVQPTGMSSL